jgi:hypothetical protein
VYSQSSERFIALQEIRNCSATGRTTSTNITNMQRSKVSFDFK